MVLLLPQIYPHAEHYGDVFRSLSVIRQPQGPKEFLFAVKMPEEKDSQRAADEICGGLRQLGVEVVDVRDEEAILEFAKIEEDSDFELKN